MAHSMKNKTVLIACLDKEDPPNHSFVDGMLAQELALQKDIEIKLLVSRTKNNRKSLPYKYMHAICIPLLFQRRRFGRLANFFMAVVLLKKLIVREGGRNKRVVLFVRNDPVLLLASSMLKKRVSRLIFQSSFPHEVVANGVKRVVAKLFYRLSAPHVDAVLAISPLGLKRTRVLFPLVPDYGYIPLLADVKAKRFSKSKKEDEIRFIYIGSHDKLRRLDVILKAVVYAVKYLDVSAKFYFVGGSRVDVNLYGSIKDVHELVERGIVVFRERVKRSEIWKLIDSADVGLCLIPPEKIYREASPTKLAEYMVNGLAVLASWGIPLQETFVNESGGGILVKFDYKSIAHGIHRLNTEHELLKIMQERARGYAEKHLNYSAYVNDFREKILAVGMIDK